MTRGKASSEAAAKRGRGRPAGSVTQKRAKRSETRPEPHADHLASVVDRVLLVDVEEARLMLGGVGRKGLYQLIHSGAIESRLVGRRRLIPVWSLEKYVGLPVSA